MCLLPPAFQLQQRVLILQVLFEDGTELVFSLVHLVKSQIHAAQMKHGVLVVRLEKVDPLEGLFEFARVAAVGMGRHILFKDLQAARDLSDDGQQLQQPA